MTRDAFTSRLVPALLLIALGVPDARAEQSLPFRGTFVGQTVSAEPTENPDVVFVVTEGGGQATHLGQYEMIIPHFSNLATLVADGEQILVAANGDLITAEFSGQFEPTADGFLVAELEATITGGTGRFEHATGSYTFAVVFDPATFISVATITGEIDLARGK
jgi:hypothetical protein